MSLVTSSSDGAGETALTPEAWVAQLQKKIKTQSRIWRQLRNQVVGLTGNPDLKEDDRLNALKGKAREQVRDLIESSLARNTSDYVSGLLQILGGSCRQPERTYLATSYQAEIDTFFILNIAI